MSRRPNRLPEYTAAMIMTVADPGLEAFLASGTAARAAVARRGRGREGPPRGRSGWPGRLSPTCSERARPPQRAVSRDRRVADRAGLRDTPCSAALAATVTGAGTRTRTCGPRTSGGWRSRTWQSAGSPSLSQAAGLMPDPDPQQFTPDWALHPGVYLRRHAGGARHPAGRARRAHRPHRQAHQPDRQRVDRRLRRRRAAPGQGTGHRPRLLDTGRGRVPGPGQPGTRPRHELPELIQWARTFDKVTLRRYGIIAAGDDKDTLVEKILRFFGVASPEAFDRTWIQPRVSFRRSQSFTVDEPNTALWLRLVERSAEHVTVPPLRPGALRKVARTIPAMTNHTVPHGFAVARERARRGRRHPHLRPPSPRHPRLRRHLVARYRTARHRPDRTPPQARHLLVQPPPRNRAHPPPPPAHHLPRPGRRKTGQRHRRNARPTNSPRPPSCLRKHAPPSLPPTTRQDLLRLATRLGVSVAIVAGHYGHATDRWTISGSLRGTITDDDIRELEQISSTGQPASRRAPGEATR